MANNSTSITNTYLRDQLAPPGEGGAAGMLVPYSTSDSISDLAGGEPMRLVEKAVAILAEESACWLARTANQ